MEKFNFLVTIDASERKERIFMNIEDEELEDVTKYGEFVASYFAWLTLDGQKEKAAKLEKMTKNKNDKK